MKTNAQAKSRAVMVTSLPASYATRRVAGDQLMAIIRSMTKDRIAAATQRRYGTALKIADIPGLEALAALNERSVCRRYRRDPVPEDVVRLLCATALAAPTKSDLQQATIVRLADPKKRAPVWAMLTHTPRPRQR